MAQPQPFDEASLELHTLPVQPQSHREYSLTLVAPADLATQVMAVPEGQQIEVDVTLTSLAEGILCHATGQAEAVGQCVRCLRQVREPIDIRVEEMFFTPEALAQIKHDDGEEAIEGLREVTGNTLEIGELLRDAVVTLMPYAPLCSPECEGLCQVCGEPLRDLPADHAHEDLDPRLAVLARLLDPDAE